MAKIIVNGEPQEVELPLNLTALIKLNNVEQPDMVSVQVNDEFADRTEWDAIQLKDGDIVETGTHNELLAKGGFYSDLWTSQFVNAEAI